MKEAGVDPTKVQVRLKEWIADMEKIKAAGIKFYYFGHELDTVTPIDDVIAADLGAQGYNGLWNGKTDGKIT